MKYIGNAFSLSMIDENMKIKVDTITKKQFINGGSQAKSIIGHPEIAELFELPLNRESITLKKGDILYVVLPRRRPYEGERVENGAVYNFIPESEGYVYKQVQALED